jgi:hypothetical protein
MPVPDGTRRLRLRSADMGWVVTRLEQARTAELPRFLRLKAAELARLADEARHPAVAVQLRRMAALYMARAQHLEGAPGVPFDGAPAGSGPGRVRPAGRRPSPAETR